MKKLKCKIFGCDFRYNFVSLPNKCICHRCNQKQELNTKTLEWENVLNFDNNLGTDNELKQRWHKL